MLHAVDIFADFLSPQNFFWWIWMDYFKVSSSIVTAIPCVTSLSLAQLLKPAYVCTSIALVTWYLNSVQELQCAVN